ncbi:exodeoxyribonuclease V subunit alpha [Myxococcota bacterium]|nr:exodeoxyribonuclease V subunit alpha [Myxococcota bacterium]
MSIAPVQGLPDTAFGARVAPFVEAGVLDATDLHVVRILAPVFGEEDPEAMLGLAFAVRAPRLGHVGVDLVTLAARIAAEGAAGDAEAEAKLGALPWPADAQDWRRRVAGSPLVGPPDAEVLAPFVLHDGLVVTRRHFRYQQRLRDAVVARLSGPETEGAGLDVPLLREGLDRLFPPLPGEAEPDLQRLAALVAVLRPFTVITGGPGTGKTFTVKKVLALLLEQWESAHGRPPRVALAAPTGKAARRLEEALREGLEDMGIGGGTREWIRGLPATTLHRLLGFRPSNSTRFRHGPEDPLGADVVVVDEASMVDLALMCKLVEAVPACARLVLLGDRDQLASVEAGSVLADLTAGAGPAGMRLRPEFAARLRALDPAAPVEGRVDPAAPQLADGIVHLSRPRRFGAETGLGRLARAIAEGSPESLDQAVAWLGGAAGEGGRPYPDLRLVPHGGEGFSDRALRWVVEGYGPYLSLLRAGPRPGQPVESHHLEVLRAFGSFRVLAAHRRGPLGVEGLNGTLGAALQAEIGAPGERSGPPSSTRGGHYVGRPILVTENRYDVGRMNGDVGILVGGARRGEVRAVFPGRAPDTVEYLDVARLPPHETVFAMTIHKSQGSQFAHPVVVLPARESPLLTRELVYTAITRAVSRVTVVGDAPLLRRALDVRVQRASSLGGMLWG